MCFCTGMRKTSSHKRYLVLGANGYLGSRLYLSLKRSNLDVRGTSRNKNDTDLLYLDTSAESSVVNFPWKNFDKIVDCIGNVDYSNSTEATYKNILINVLGPVSIVKNLSKGQIYYYLSTHAVLLSGEKHNTYSLSKLLFEQLLKKMNDIESKVTLVRMPAVFSGDRNGGLFHKIKSSFYNKKPIVIDFISYKWHPMLADRAIGILKKVVLSEDYITKIDIGYPAECSINDILACAENIYRGKYVTVRNIQTDHYIPNTNEQDKICRINSILMNNDIKLFFNAPIR